MSGPARGTAVPAPSQRLDKWLWFARVVKSRTLAATLVTDGKIRVNRARVVKPSHLVKAGDVITAGTHRDVRTLKVLAPGARRGPPSEAMSLYEELTPPLALTRSSPARRGQPGGEGEQPSEAGTREPGAGRPTKKERRQTDWLKGRGP
jgi:ribosome-associated heat shock protein Hsp15